MQTDDCRVVRERLLEARNRLIVPAGGKVDGGEGDRGRAQEASRLGVEGGWQQGHGEAVLVQPWPDIGAGDRLEAGDVPEGGAVRREGKVESGGGQEAGVVAGLPVRFEGP